MRGQLRRGGYFRWEVQQDFGELRDLRGEAQSYLLRQAHDLNVVVGVLEDPQALLFVEEVKDLAAVDLEEAHADAQPLGGILRLRQKEEGAGIGKVNTS